MEPSAQVHPLERCQLVRRWLPADGVARGCVVALHESGADLEQLVPLARAAAPQADLCAPQAPRSCNPLLSSGHPGTLALGPYRGFSWYRSSGDGAIEPSSFGDSLAQLAALLLELRASAPTPRPHWLLGLRDGATLALALARALPEAVDGVVALAAGEPLPAGWSPEPLAVSDAPIMPPVLQLESAADPPLEVAAQIGAWLARQEVRDGSG